MIEPDSVFHHDPDVAWRLVQDEALLVDPRGGRIYPLNAVAARIWSLAGESRSLAEIVDTLAQEFEAPLDRIRVDACHFIEKLLEARLLIPNRSSKGIAAK